MATFPGNQSKQYTTSWSLKKNGSTCVLCFRTIGERCDNLRSNVLRTSAFFACTRCSYGRGDTSTTVNYRRGGLSVAVGVLEHRGEGKVVYNPF